MKSTNELINRIRLVQSKIDDTETLCKETDNAIENYETIKNTALIYRNVKEAVQIHKQLEEFSAVFKRVDELFSSPEKNLLLLCFYITKANYFKSECEKGPDDSSHKKISLGIYFEKLDSINKTFDKIFLQIIDRFVFYAEKEMSQVIVWAVKVAETRDEVESVLLRITSKIEARFLVKEKDIHARLDSIGFWKKEMFLVDKKISVCFKDSFGVKSRLIKTYHQGIHDTIQQTGLQTLTAPEILFLFSWIAAYYEELQTAHEIKREAIQPDLIQQQQEMLFKRYVMLCAEKIKNWIVTLARNEVKCFSEMKELPEKNEKELYLSPSAVDLFQVVKQHTDAVKTAKNKRLDQAILFKCLESISLFQNEILLAIDEETKKYLLILTKENETIPPYFEEYLLMFGNTCLRWIEYMAVIEEQNVDCTENEKIKLETCNTGFLEIAKKVNSSLVDIMRTTLLPAFKALFTEQWFSSNLVDQITATISEYFQAYKPNYHPFLLLNLMKESALAVSVDYLKSLKTNSFKIKNTASFYKLFEQDTSKLASLYLSIIQQKDLISEISEGFSSLANVLFKSTSSTLLSFLIPLFQKHGDVSSDFLMSVLLKREDMKKADVKDSISEINKRKQNGQYKEKPSPFFVGLK